MQLSPNGGFAIYIYIKKWNTNCVRFKGKEEKKFLFWLELYMLTDSIFLHRKDLYLNNLQDVSADFISSIIKVASQYMCHETVSIYNNIC